MTTALQTVLPLRALRLTRLMDVHCVRERLGLNEDQALALARAEWGFDISSGRSRRRELRLLPSVVAHFEELGRPRARAEDWDAVKAELLRGAVKTLDFRPATLTYLEGTAAQFILNCSSTHVTDFVRCGQFKQVPGTCFTTGPNGTPKITAESFLEFLRKRRVKS